MPETLPQTKDWKVLDFREGKTEPNSHGGELQKFYVDFEGCPDVYWRRKAGNAPVPGETYYGTIEQGNYGPMFKAAQRPDDGSTGSADYGTKKGGREWKPEAQYDPEKVARIGRAHAQGMAIQLLDASGGLDEANTAQTRAALTEWTDWFEADVDNAAAKAAQGAGVKSGGNGSSEAPAPEQDPVEFLKQEAGATVVSGAGSANADDDIPF